MTTPAQDVIVKAWFARAAYMYDAEADNSLAIGERYSPIDYATAKDLDIPVESVGEALVAAGKRPPVWWLG